MTKELFNAWIEDKENEKFFCQENFILEVSELIQSELDAKNVTRKDLADKLGKSKAFVSQILSGSRNLTLRTLSDICYALKVYPEVGFREDKPEGERHLKYDVVSTSGYKSLGGKSAAKRNFANVVKVEFNAGIGKVA